MWRPRLVSTTITVRAQYSGQERCDCVDPTDVSPCRLSARRARWDDRPQQGRWTGTLAAVWWLGRCSWLSVLN